MDTIDRTKKQLGARIKSVRKARKLTQEQLAERAEINSVYLSKIEHGKENPTLTLLIRIALALEVDVQDLFDYQQEASSKAQKETLRRLISQIDDDNKLKVAVRVARALLR